MLQIANYTNMPEAVVDNIIFILIVLLVTAAIGILIGWVLRSPKMNAFSKENESLRKQLNTAKTDAKDTKNIAPQLDTALSDKAALRAELDEAKATITAHAETIAAHTDAIAAHATTIAATTNVNLNSDNVSNDTVAFYQRRLANLEEELERLKNAADRGKNHQIPYTRTFKKTTMIKRPGIYIER